MPFQLQSRQNSINLAYLVSIVFARTCLQLSQRKLIQTGGAALNAHQLT